MGRNNDTMKPVLNFLFVLIFLGGTLVAGGSNSAVQPGNHQEIIHLKTASGTLEGELLIPQNIRRPPVVLIIAGSGPTDRDGNNPSMKNNSLKFLAEGLADKGIASLRYDKRGVGGSSGAIGKESELRFENFVSDAEGWIGLLRKDKRFKGIYVAGHSEGSLIGILAVQNEKVRGLISIAGAGRSIDLVLKEQLGSQPDTLKKMAYPILDSLKVGKTVQKIPAPLYALFRPSVQPYLISWLRYDPGKEIARLKIPVLILQGTSDIQIGTEDARILAKNSYHPRLVIVEGMNHILKTSGPNRLENMMTYSNPDLPVKKELIDSIYEFICR